MYIMHKRNKVIDFPLRVYQIHKEPFSISLYFGGYSLIYFNQKRQQGKKKEKKAHFYAQGGQKHNFMLSKNNSKVRNIFYLYLISFLRKINFQTGRFILGFFFGPPAVSREGPINSPLCVRASVRASVRP